MSDKSPWHIRAALPNDLPIVVEFNRLLALETEAKDLDLAVLTEGVRSALADPAKARYFIACDSELPIGQLMLTCEWSDWRNGEIWWIQSVYVQADYRRRGVYRALHERVVERAIVRGGVVGLRLYVEENNHAGQATYLNVGMQPAGYRVLEQMFEARVARP